MLAAIALGQLSNVMGCLSTYGIGSAPPYYGAGYVPQSKWYQLGFLLSIFYISVWLFAGGAWWKVSQRLRTRTWHHLHRVCHVLQYGRDRAIPHAVHMWTALADDTLSLLQVLGLW